MFVFPAFLTPTPVATIGVLLPLIVIPVVLILFVVWHVKKLNRIDRTLLEIIEKLKNNWLSFLENRRSKLASGMFSY